MFKIKIIDSQYEVYVTVHAAETVIHYRYTIYLLIAPSGVLTGNYEVIQAIQV